MAFRFKGSVFGPLLLTVCNQGGGAPIVDRAFSRTQDGREFEGRAILLTPWRRDQYGDSEPQRALFVGWRRRARAKGARWERIGEWIADHCGDRFAWIWCLWMHLGCALRNWRDGEGSWVSCYTRLSPVRYADAWPHRTRDGGKHLQCEGCGEIGFLLRQAERSKAVAR